MSSSEMTIAKRNTIVVVMLISAFVAMLNQTILNTALPAIISGLGIPETTAQWLITGFMLVNGVMIPLTAFLMDRYSTRGLYIFSMAAAAVRERQLKSNPHPMGDILNVWERGRRLLFEDSLIYRKMLAEEDQAEAGGGL